MVDCFYCTQDERLDDLMTFICALPWSRVYLLRNQRYPGRCVVAFHRHIRDITEMSTEERSGFFSDLAKVADTINALYKPDKINYAVYGDIVSHFHVHLVPKKKDGPEWGGPFRDDVEKVYLSLEEFERALQELRQKLGS